MLYNTIIFPEREVVRVERTVHRERELLKALRDEQGVYHHRIAGPAEIHADVKIDGRQQAIDKVHRNEMQEAVIAAEAARRQGVGLHMVGALL